MNRRQFMTAAIAGTGLGISSSRAGHQGNRSRQDQILSWPAEPIPVKTHKQLFVDNKLIDSSTGVKLCVNPPVKQGAVMTAKGPIESGRIGYYATIIKGKDEYLMYYQALGTWYKRDVEDHMICLATSKDGLNWIRESVNLYKIAGYKENNVVLPGCAGTVFTDPNQTSGYRYWWFGQTSKNNWWDESNGAVRTYHGPGVEGGQYLMKSKDGRVWQRGLQEPVLPFWCDTQNQCFYDDRLKKYVAYVRGWHPTRTDGLIKRRRVVCRTSTTELLQAPWPFRQNPDRERGPNGLYGEIEQGELPIVISADHIDPQPADIYTPGVIKYPYAPDIYLAFPMVYRHYPRNQTNPRDFRGQRGNDGPAQVQLAVSRDGIHFQRFRQPYIPLGRMGQEDAGVTNMAWGMIRSGDELWQYYCGVPHTHGGYRYRQHDHEGMIARVIQRLDGFVSVDADNSGGKLVTPPLLFEGNRLHLNVDCGAMGEVWIELQDKDHKPISGFTLDDSISIDRNGTAQEVWWKNGPDVGKLGEKPVRLHIKMRSAKLYAFQFVNKN